MNIVGIDEVGRGCWAGPLVAGAVVLRAPIPGLKDSKKLSKKQRESLSKTILQEAPAYGLGWVWPKDIDAYGLTAAVTKAMKEALTAINVPFDQIIIDGSYNFLDEEPRTKTLVRADDSVPAVSAASIIAKVARDNWMTRAAIAFPEYGFEKHVGYGTKMHIEALKQYGPCELHRLSYKPIKAVHATI